MNCDPEVMRYFPKVLTPPETEAFVQRIVAHFQERGFGLYAVDELSTATFIGFIGFQSATFQSEFTPCIEVGWRLARTFWGKGYATEGATACLRHGFTKLGLQEVCSFTAEVNLRSVRVMQKVGFKYRRDFHHPRLDPTHFLSTHVLYGLTRREYETSGEPRSQAVAENSPRI